VTCDVLEACCEAFELEPWLKDCRAMVEVALKKAMEAYRGRVPPMLFEAMEYSLLNGGKRLRPVLAIASAKALGKEASSIVLDFGCAVEMVHSYSLIHDDLPALDNDSLRRGHRTNHVVFGEAMAILAGDALLTEAFAVISRGSEAVRIRLCSLLACSSGARGMVGGQVDDIQEKQKQDIESLELLHGRKTGALIAAACAGGARAAGANESQVSLFHQFGARLGLAFQIVDDLIDIEGDPLKTGKSKGNDARNGKVTFPSILGKEKSLERARNEIAQAKELLQGFMPAALPLMALADYAIERDR
jgi:geranylgeranyl diphosphate synthase, type II